MRPGNCSFIQLQLRFSITTCIHQEVVQEGHLPIIMIIVATLIDAHLYRSKDTFGPKVSHCNTTGNFL